MSKLSKVQKEVLGHMVQGHKIYSSHEHTWLDKVPDKRGGYKSVHANTLYALRVRDCVERVDTDKTPWYRRDYAITDTGRELLRQVRGEQ